MKNPFQFLFQPMSKKMMLFLLILFCANVAITYFFPNVTGLWTPFVILFAVVLFAPVIFPHFSDDPFRSIARTPLTPALGIYVIVALLLGALIQIYLLPQLANFLGFTGYFTSNDFPLVPLILLGVVLIFCRKK